MIEANMGIRLWSCFQQRSKLKEYLDVNINSCILSKLALVIRCLLCGFQWWLPAGSSNLFRIWVLSMFNLQNWGSCLWAWYWWWRNLCWKQFHMRHRKVLQYIYSYFVHFWHVNLWPEPKLSLRYLLCMKKSTVYYKSEL